MKHPRPLRIRHGSPSGSVALAALHERQVNHGFVGCDLVREPQLRAALGGPVVRVNRSVGSCPDTANHASQFPHPQVQSDLQEGRFVLEPRRGGQGAEPVQGSQGVGIVGRWQTGAKSLADLGQRLRAAFQRAQDVHECAVRLQVVGKRHPCFKVIKGALHGRAKQRLVSRAEVFVGAFASDTILHAAEVGSRHEVPPEKRVSKKPINGHAALADQVVLVERLSEHLGYVLPQAAVISGTESRGRADTAETGALRPESCLEPTNQTG